MQQVFYIEYNILVNFLNKRNLIVIVFKAVYYYKKSSLFNKKYENISCNKYFVG